ncbi:signal transduction histidine kinase [Rhodoligotrophos appendicifer]|uniref:sensor histidine kinase n=1 Tax=Rhodoligotrophos appendicifer TaxID=987056 RepID=UPI001184F677|nr:HAMP domain-containing sensor histidine kinase [Rhodoligotrophos appendicifer]
MRLNSLTFRLIASAALISVIIIFAAGVLLSSLFQEAVERNFDARLQAVLDGLLASVELTKDGTLTLRETLADSRFGLPLSGWYWQVSSVDSAQPQNLPSDSLLEQRLEIPPGALETRDENGLARFFLSDADSRRLRAIEQRYRLFGSDDAYSFVVAGNFDELRAEISAFTNTLILVLTLLGMGLMAAIFVQVRYGLRPMRQLQREISGIRAGSANRITGSFPVEIEDIAQELNALIQSNSEVIDRARTQVGNLAHALKTPLSVLTNEANSNEGPLAQKVVEQLQVMRDQVNLYLDRARLAARAQSLGAVTDVAPVVDALVRTLQRINIQRNIQVNTEISTQLRFRGEKQDLEEMVGNLLDNAFKWTNGTILVRAVQAPSRSGGRGNWLTISVHDDGPGLPAERRAEALKRGHRLDETKPGSGLGLSIVAEAAGMYGGFLNLSSSELGGLLVELRLPAAG